MLLIAFDTETSGLPVWSKPSSDPEQPHIVQLAAILRDGHDKTAAHVGTMNRLIKPEGWIIPPELTAIHGITTEQAEAEGVRLADALDEFLSMAIQAEQNIGYNVNFDKRMLRIQEKRRHGAAVEDDQLPISIQFARHSREIDIAKFMTKICNLPPSEKMMAAGRKTAKMPKLGEAFQHAYPGKAVDGKLHDAMTDVKCTLAIYWWIYEQGGLGAGQDRE